MSGTIATLPKLQFFSATGTPLAGGTIDVYLAGTTTRTNTWQDSALTSLNTNPLVLDSRGMCMVWLDSAKTYKMVLKSSSGVSQWTQDNLVGGVNGAVELSAAAIESARLAAVNGAAVVTAAKTVILDKNRGALAADPATRTDGTANQVGDEYFNTATNIKMVYRTTGWLAFESVASAKATEAASSASVAATAKTAAEAARDASFVTGPKYATEALGRAAVADGVNFMVQGSGDVAALEYRRTSSAVSVLIASYPASATVAALQALVRDEYTELYAYTIRDTAGRVAFGVKNDGTVVALDLTLSTINGLTTTGLTASIATATALAQGAADKTAAFSTMTGIAPVYTINDPAGRTVFEVAADGTVSLAALKVATINGGSALGLRPAYGGTFDSELVYFNNTGQSLGTGPTGAITKVQEYDNIGFPEGVNNTAAPTAYFPLTAANCSQTGDTEPPIFGAMGSLKELIARENGIAYTAQKYQLLATDNSHGSYAITALKKGQALYQESLAQVTAAKGMADAESRTFTAGGVFWTQGEADAANGYAYYLGALKQLATDFNTDFKAITGQAKDIHFITYQCGSPANTDVAHAQLQASLDLPNLIHMACPMYQFDYQSDGVHINSDSSKWLGGYYGLVYKRVAIDGVTWTPTRPVSSFVQGKFANVKFNVMVRPLVLDTALIPAQTNSGFTLVTSAGADLAISSVTVSGPDTIKVVAAAAIPAGAKLRYGYNTAIGKGGYIRGCGNLRDSQGEIASYYNHPLHNWCVFFEFPL